jgi:TatD DNase family protein
MMACPYCIKHKWAGAFRGNDLALTKEPTASQTIEAIQKLGQPSNFDEIIFCGYGDALIRLDETVEIAKWIKQNGGKTRVNTAGLANAFYKENILPRLKGLIDAISVSLNGTNPRQHNELNKPMFAETAFNEIINFAKEAKNYIPSVTITAVELPGLDIKKVEEIAKNAKVNFRARPYLDAYEDH